MSFTQSADSDQAESCRPIDVPDMPVVEIITRDSQDDSKYSKYSEYGLPADNFEPKDSESEAYHAAQEGQSEGGQSGA